MHALYHIAYTVEPLLEDALSIMDNFVGPNGVRLREVPLYVKNNFLKSPHYNFHWLHLQCNLTEQFLPALQCCTQ